MVVVPLAISLSRKMDYGFSSHGYFSFEENEFDCGCLIF